MSCCPNVRYIVYVGRQKVFYVCTQEMFFILTCIFLKGRLPDSSFCTLVRTFLKTSPRCRDYSYSVSGSECLKTDTQKPHHPLVIQPAKPGRLEEFLPWLSRLKTNSSELSFFQFKSMHFKVLAPSANFSLKKLTT
jgi:hypothetical protein